MKKILIINGIIALIFITGCATHKMVYSPMSTYSGVDSRDINDEDILKAFQAAPQKKLPATVAWYSLSVDSILSNSKISNKNIIINYDIPQLLIEGENYYKGYYRKGYYYYGEPRKISLKQLRYFAAKAKCDILILVSSSLHEEVNPNWMVAFAPLLITMAFLPMDDLKLTYEAQCFIFDVRNGYMYKHMKFKEIKERKRVIPLEMGKIIDKETKLLIKNAGLKIKNELKAFFIN